MVDLGNNMDTLKEEYKAIPKELRIRIIKRLYQQGTTRLCPSGKEIVDYYKKYLKK